MRRACSNCRTGVFVTHAIAHYAQYSSVSDGPVLYLAQGTTGIIIAPGEAWCHLGHQPVGLNNAGLGLSAGVAEPVVLPYRSYKIAA